MRLTKASKTECPACEGTGETRETAPVMEYKHLREHGPVQVRTILQGSGCPRCLGLGQLR